MDGNRFDHWTASIAPGVRTRRGLMQLGLAAVAAAVGVGVTTSEALACRKDRRKCVRDGQCCSGKCKRVRQGVKKCDPAPGAFGCTVNRNSCNVSDRLPCPGKSDGFCLTLDNGRPFCADEVTCFRCESDQECNDLGIELGLEATGRCVRNCRACGDDGDRACIFNRQAPATA